MITHLIKPGTVFFLNQSNPESNIPAGVLMVVTERRSSSCNWSFRRLTSKLDCEAVIDGHNVPIYLKYDDQREETIIGQLPPGELHTMEWKPEYLLPSIPRTQPAKGLVGLLKKLW